MTDSELVIVADGDEFGDGMSSQKKMFTGKSNDEKGEHIPLRKSPKEESESPTKKTEKPSLKEISDKTPKKLTQSQSRCFSLSPDREGYFENRKTLSLARCTGTEQITISSVEFERCGNSPSVVVAKLVDAQKEEQLAAEEAAKAEKEKNTIGNRSNFKTRVSCKDIVGKSPAMLRSPSCGAGSLARSPASFSADRTSKKRVTDIMSKHKNILENSAQKTPKNEVPTTPSKGTRPTESTTSSAFNSSCTNRLLSGLQAHINASTDYDAEAKAKAAEFRADPWNESVDSSPRNGPGLTRPVATRATFTDNAASKSVGFRSQSDTSRNGILGLQFSRMQKSISDVGKSPSKKQVSRALQRSKKMVADFTPTSQFTPPAPIGFNQSQPQEGAHGMDSPALNCSVSIHESCASPVSVIDPASPGGVHTHGSGLTPGGSGFSVKSQRRKSLANGLIVSPTVNLKLQPSPGVPKLPKFTNEKEEREHLGFGEDSPRTEDGKRKGDGSDSEHDDSLLWEGPKMDTFLGPHDNFKISNTPKTPKKKALGLRLPSEEEIQNMHQSLPSALTGLGETKSETSSSTGNLIKKQKHRLKSMLAKKEKSQAKDKENSYGDDEFDADHIPTRTVSVTADENSARTSSLVGADKPDGTVSIEMKVGMCASLSDGILTNLAQTIVASSMAACESSKSIDRSGVASVLDLTDLSTSQAPFMGEPALNTDVKADLQRELGIRDDRALTEPDEEDRLKSGSLKGYDGMKGPDSSNTSKSLKYSEDAKCSLKCSQDATCSLLSLKMKSATIMRGPNEEAAKVENHAEPNTKTRSISMMEQSSSIVNMPDRPEAGPASLKTAGSLKTRSFKTTTIPEGGVGLVGKTVSPDGSRNAGCELATVEAMESGSPKSAGRVASPQSGLQITSPASPEPFHPVFSPESSSVDAESPGFASPEFAPVIEFAIVTAESAAEFEVSKFANSHSMKVDSVRAGSSESGPGLTELLDSEDMEPTEEDMEAVMIKKASLQPHEIALWQKVTDDLDAMLSASSGAPSVKTVPDPTPLAALADANHDVTKAAQLDVSFTGFSQREASLTATATTGAVPCMIHSIAGAVVDGSQHAPMEAVPSQIAQTSVEDKILSQTTVHTVDEGRLDEERSAMDSERPTLDGDRSALDEDRPKSLQSSGTIGELQRSGPIGDLGRGIHGEQNPAVTMDIYANAASSPKLIQNCPDLLQDRELLPDLKQIAAESLKDHIDVKALKENAALVRKAVTADLVQNAKAHIAEVAMRSNTPRSQVAEDSQSLHGVLAQVRQQNNVVQVGQPNDVQFAQENDVVPALQQRVDPTSDKLEPADDDLGAPYSDDDCESESDSSSEDGSVPPGQKAAQPAARGVRFAADPDIQAIPSCQRNASLIVPRPQTTGRDTEKILNNISNHFNVSTPSSMMRRASVLPKLVDQPKHWLYEKMDRNDQKMLDMVNAIEQQFKKDKKNKKKQPPHSYVVKTGSSTPSLARSHHGKKVVRPSSHHGCHNGRREQRINGNNSDQNTPKCGGIGPHSTKGGVAHHGKGNQNATWRAAGFNKAPCGMTKSPSGSQLVKKPQKPRMNQSVGGRKMGPDSGRFAANTAAFRDAFGSLNDFGHELDVVLNEQLEDPTLQDTQKLIMEIEGDDALLDLPYLESPGLLDSECGAENPTKNIDGLPDGHQTDGDLKDQPKLMPDSPVQHGNILFYDNNRPVYYDVREVEADIACEEARQENVRARNQDIELGSTAETTSEATIRPDGVSEPTLRPSGTTAFDVRTTTPNGTAKKKTVTVETHDLLNATTFTVSAKSIQKIYCGKSGPSVSKQNVGQKTPQKSVQRPSWNSTAVVEDPPAPITIFRPPDVKTVARTSVSAFNSKASFKTKPSSAGRFRPTLLSTSMSPKMELDRVDKKQRPTSSGRTISKDGLISAGGKRPVRPLFGGAAGLRLNANLDLQNAIKEYEQNEGLFNRPGGSQTLGKAPRSNAERVSVEKMSHFDIHVVDSKSGITSTKSNPMTNTIIMTTPVKARRNIQSAKRYAQLLENEYKEKTPYKTPSNKTPNKTPTNLANQISSLLFQTPMQDVEKTPNYLSVHNKNVLNGHANPYNSIYSNMNSADGNPFRNVMISNNGMAKGMSDNMQNMIEKSPYNKVHTSPKVNYNAVSHAYSTPNPNPTKHEGGIRIMMENGTLFYANSPPRKRGQLPLKRLISEDFVSHLPEDNVQDFGPQQFKEVGPWESCTGGVPGTGAGGVRGNGPADGCLEKSGRGNTDADMQDNNQAGQQGNLQHPLSPELCDSPVISCLCDSERNRVSPGNPSPRLENLLQDSSGIRSASVQ